MAIALVQTGTEIDIVAGTSGTITLTGVTAGNLLTVVVDDVDGNAVSFTVSDDKGNAWLSAVSNDNGGYSSAILYCLSAIAGTTVITVTSSGTTDFVAQAQEWSGGVWSLDTTSFIDEGSTTSHVCSASSSVIDTTGADLVLCNSTTNNGTSFGTRTAGSGYTDFSGPGGASDYSRAMWQWQVFSTAQTNERGAFTSANSKATAACIAAFLCGVTCMSDGGGGGCWWPCCSSPGVNTPGCAPEGSVGSESGSECDDCGTSVILDDFSGTLAAWSVPIACGSDGIGSPGYVISGGVVVVAAPAEMIRSFPRPSLTGFCVQVRATMPTLPAGGVHGIALAYGRMFFARPALGDYGRHSCITFEGCIGSGSVFKTFGPAPANGDVISMTIRDDGSGLGLFTVCYQVNGTTIRVEEGVRFCFDTTMWAGLITTATTPASFDDFEVLTN